jgi:hypothetical protein
MKPTKQKETSKELSDKIVELIGNLHELISANICAIAGLAEPDPEIADRIICACFEVCAQVVEDEKPARKKQRDN